MTEQSQTTTSPSRAVPKPKTAKLPVYETRADGSEVCSDTAAGKREYHRRTQEMAKRQRYVCPLCNIYMHEPTYDHQRGRGMAGGFRDDRIEIDGKWHNAAVHFLCNGVKGSKRYHWHQRRYVPA